MSGRSPRLKNTQNQGFLFCGVKTKIKVIVWKISRINEKHVHEFHKLLNINKGK
jgi:hypothetical protein